MPSAERLHFSSQMECLSYFCFLRSCKDAVHALGEMRWQGGPVGAFLVPPVPLVGALRRAPRNRYQCL